jgi:hypothetical protein
MKIYLRAISCTKRPMSFALFPLEAEDVDRVDTGEEDNFSQMTEY